MPASPEDRSNPMFDDLRLDLKEHLYRPVTDKDVEYLCNYRYPYLQIMKTDAKFEGEIKPQFVKLKNHWVIFDYGDAMCCAYPHEKDARKGDEEGGEGGEGGGSGTIIKQQFDAALAMIGEAKTKGWASVEIIAGTHLMQLYAWIAAQMFGLVSKGFTPNAEDEKHHKVVAKEAERIFHAELNKG
jgi:hypothetical protein